MSEPTSHRWPAGTRRLQVHDVQVDLRFRRVIRPDQETELPQRMFDLLLVFLAEPQVLHSRADLFARVWPGVIVEDANLSQSVWMLRKALGESRKHWIRTVAKSGYVFEPPSPVEAMDDTTGPVTAAAPTPAPIDKVSAPVSEPPVTAVPEPAPAPPSSPPPTRRGRRWLRWAAAAVIALGAVGVTAWWLHERAARQAQLSEQLAIALINVEDKAAPEESRWPVTLLHAWLGWKLDSLPEVTLLTEAHLAADSEGRSPQIVFISSSADSANPNLVSLRARFDLHGVEQRLEKVGTQAQVPAMADELSRELLARLVPGRASEKWPALALDAGTARRYAEGVDALERRDWVSTTKILQDVVDRAPKFGLPRFQLGYVLARLARAAPAIEQTQTAIELLKPVPDDVAAVMHAELLARDPQRSAQAAQAFGALAKRHPEKSVYLLDQANMLLNAGQPNDALVLLDQPQWHKKSVGTQLRQRLNLASAYMSLGDVTKGRAQARVAEHIARNAGKGWEQELGEALLLLAQADSYQYQEKADLSGYERAAKEFEAAGDDMDALYARFLAESFSPGNSGEGNLDMLLVQARERGYRRLEVDMLRMAAFRHYGSGDMAAYRARLEQALATALAAGDTYEQHLLELDLLNEDFMRGRYESAEHRLASLRKAGLQGDNAIWVAQSDAVIAANQGNLAGARAALDDAEQRNRAAHPSEDPTIATSRMDCLRADISLIMGEMGRSRSEWKSCVSTQQPSARLQASIGNGAIDVLGGDRATGLKQLQAAYKQIQTQPDGPDRWLTELVVAIQLNRAGDHATAERIAARVLPLAKQTDYEWISANAELGLAENAAIRGDWAKVREYVDSVRHSNVARMWVMSYRLDVLDALLAMQQHDGKRAYELLSANYLKARSHGDAVSQLELQSLLPVGMSIGDCNERCQAALVARTGLRGATLAWLAGPAKVDTTVLTQGKPK